MPFLRKESKPLRSHPGGGGGGGGGGHSGTEGGRTRVTYFAAEGVFFLRPPQVPDFVKKMGTFLYPGTKYIGVKIPLQSTKYTRL